MVLDKQQFFSILKNLHDVCRNNPKPKMIGMDAYFEIINYLMLRHVSDNNNLSDDDTGNLKYYYLNFCQNEHIEADRLVNNTYQSTNTSGIEKQELYSEKLSKLFLPRIASHTENENIGFVKILGKDELTDLIVNLQRLTLLIRGENGNTDGGMKAQLLINKLYTTDFLPVDNNSKFSLTLFPYDALGEGFEQFMKDAGSSGGNWGQYFTNQQVINWIYSKVPTTYEHTILDPYAGSGGFLLGAINYYTNTDALGNKTCILDKNKIYGQDYDDKIAKSLKFNCKITGLKSENVTIGDSYNYFSYLKGKEGEIDRIFANPPFGESLDILLNGYKDLTSFWGCMKSGKYTVKNSMLLATWSIYKMLNVGGIAGFVCDRGILNNGTDKNTVHKKLRKELIEKCNITDILLLPKGIFTHTSFDTAVIIMEKGKQTTEIKWHQGYFKNEDKGTSNKTMYVKENILKTSFKKLCDKDWSLKYDDYIEKVEISYEGIEYKTLGEVCEYVKGYAFKSTEFVKDKTNSNVQVIKVESIQKFKLSGDKYYIKVNDVYNKYLISKNNIIIVLVGNTFGKLYLHDIDEKFYVNQNQIILKAKYINFKYIFYNLIFYNFKSSKNNAQPFITINDLQKIKIPILSDEHQTEIVEFLDKFTNGDYNKLNNLISKFKDIDLFKILIKKDFSGFDKLYEYYEDLCFMESQLQKFENEHFNNLKKSKFQNLKNYETKPLGDVCDFDIGSTPESKNTSYYKDGTYLWCSVGDLNYGKIIDTTKKLTQHAIDNCRLKLVPKDSLMMSFKLSIGKLGVASCDMYCNEAIAFFKNYKNINKMYLYYVLLLTDYDKQKHLFNSQISISLNKSTLYKLKIPVPSLEEQERIVNEIEELDKQDNYYKKGIDSMKTMINTIYTSINTIVNS